MTKVLVRTLLTCLFGALVAFCGCIARERYIEGTMTQIGLYVPVESSVYGVQCLNYLNGVSVQTLTNQPMTVQREYVSSNSYFGIITTTERSKTDVEIKK